MKVMSNFRIDEISAVDRPAQEDAKAVIEKAKVEHPNYVRHVAPLRAVIAELQKQAPKTKTSQEAFEQARDELGDRAPSLIVLRRALKSNPEAYGYSVPQPETKADRLAKKIESMVQRGLNDLVNAKAEEIRKQTQCSQEDSRAAARLMLEDDGSHDALLKRTEEIFYNDKCSHADALIKARKEGVVLKKEKLAQHPFEKRVVEMMGKHRCSRTDAMQKARQKFPVEYEAYQRAA